MNNVKIVSKDLITVLLTKPVGSNAAALSYCLTLSAFPFLICLTAILSSLHIQETDVFGLLDGVIPEVAYDALYDYLTYISTMRTEVIFTIGLVAMLTSSSAAFRTFISFMGEVQGKMRFGGIMKIVISFLFSVLFLAAIYGSVLVIISGRWLTSWLDAQFHLYAVTELWMGIRFVIMFLLLFVAIYCLYWFSAPKDAKYQPRLPGALAAAVVLVAASIVYSHIISASMRYEILYGSLAAFVVLLLWLYTCSIILIMANVLNISIGKMRKGKSSEKLLETDDSGTVA